MWSVKADGSDLRQHTRLKGWDVRHASMDGAGGTQAVLAIGADLYRLDLAGNAPEQKLTIALSVSGARSRSTRRGPG